MTGPSQFNEWIFGFLVLIFTHSLHLIYVFLYQSARPPAFWVRRRVTWNPGQGLKRFQMYLLICLAVQNEAIQSRNKRLNNATACTKFVSVVTLWLWMKNGTKSWRAAWKVSLLICQVLSLNARVATYFMAQFRSGRDPPGITDVHP